MADVYVRLKELLDTPERIDLRKKTHPYCVECLTGCNPRTYKGSQPERRKRDYVIECGDPKCTGVYTADDVNYAYAELKKDGNTFSKEDIRGYLNPSYWLANNTSIKGEPTQLWWYEDRVIRCTASKKVLRMSRRAGKTELMSALVSYLLYMAPRPYFEVLAVCPQQPQAKEIFEKSLDLITSNPELQNSAVDKRTPYFEIKVPATMNRMRIFTAGSKSGSKALGVRGQGANLLILDEMDYLQDEDISTIMPITTDQAGCDFIGASTLKGTETFFYRFCHTTNIKEFYIPFKSRPDWNEEKNEEARRTCPTQLHWDLEYDVEWTGKIDGVFQKPFINSAFGRKKFSYGDFKYNPKWNYFIGVDWNGDNNGTRIMVLGYCPLDNMLYTIDKHVVSQKGWTQTVAINEIIKLNRKWCPDRLVLDKGFGQFQDEVIRSVGLAAQVDVAKGDTSPEAMADAKLTSIVDVVDFGGKIEVPHLYTKIDGEEKYAKQYLVENLQRVFENEEIHLAQDDELRAQLLDYVIAKFASKGVVYKAGVAGDHDLDALALATFGFSKIFHPEFRERRLVSTASIVKQSKEVIETDAANKESERILSKDREDKKVNSSKSTSIIAPLFNNGFNRASKSNIASRSILDNPLVNIRKLW